MSFSDSDTFHLVHSHSCSPSLQTFVSQVPSQGLSDYIFYCIETKSHLELLVSTVSGLWFPGSPARPPIKSQPPTGPLFLPPHPASSPSSTWVPCPSAPLTLSLGSGYLVLAEQCGLSACIKCAVESTTILGGQKLTDSSFESMSPEFLFCLLIYLF